MPAGTAAAGDGDDVARGAWGRSCERHGSRPVNDSAGGEGRQ